MASSPQFGGTNDVMELDIGQTGSTRFAANDARFTGAVEEGPDQTAVARHTVPGQSVVFRGVSGFTGKKVTWRGVLKCKDDAMLADIAKELNAKKHGGHESNDPAELKATMLTNRSDRVLSEHAVLVDWRLTDRVRALANDANFALVTQIEIEFDCLKGPPSTP